MRFPRPVMPSRRLLALAVVAVTAVSTIGFGALAWGSTLRDDGRLLEGTTIASVDVGGANAQEALAAVEAHFAAQLDQVVEVTYEDRRWETTARRLGATTDAEEVIREALERGAAADWFDLARTRLTGGTAGPTYDVTVDVPQEQVAAFVAGIGEEIDREPQDARITWSGAAFELSGDQPGLQVDREAAVEDLTAAFDEAATVVPLPVDALQPRLTAETARQVADRTGAAIDGALDRAVTVALEGSTWTVTPRELGAVPDIEPLLAAALEAGDGTVSPADVQLEIPGGAITGFIGNIAAGVDQAPTDARLDWSSGAVQITAEQPGRAVARDAATADLRNALQGGGERVELSVVSVEPSVTSASFEHTLLLNQGQRRLYYYRGGNLVREWSVAVGSGGSPTPTGVFTVGAKRYEPTWYNPAPDTWGAELPPIIGPGPDNPLGVRAINWNQGGRDTLIRFHGTPNEDSIGSAASKGCVRMYKADIIELYDLVPSGATIVST